MPRLAAVCMAMVLSACGGGGSDLPGCTPHPVSIALFGDSTQVGAYNVGALQRYLEARFGKDGVRIELRAVSSTYSGQLVAGQDGLNLPWPQSVHADIVLMNHGINDAGYSNLTDYVASLQVLEHAPAVVIFETPNPVSGQAYSTAPYAQAMRDVAARAHLAVADVQAYVLGVPNWQADLPDGVHPAAAMHELIAANVTGPVVAKAVQVAGCR